MAKSRKRIKTNIGKMAFNAGFLRFFNTFKAAKYVLQNK
jgi:hypothetical protein